MVDRGSLSREIMLRILERARLAPSGDNTQPWRFEIVSADQLIVHGHDTRDEILYDFDGHASHMAHGALLETIRIAASAEGLSMTWSAKCDTEWRTTKYCVCFRSERNLESDPLHLYIEKRTVQRRPMLLKPLSQAQRNALIEAAGSDHSLRLFETFSERKAIAGLLWKNAQIRLTCPEAFLVHKSIIEWGARFSKDRIPEQAVGVGPLTAKLMQWVMRSWKRVDFFNRYLMGTIPPRIQLDYIPALMCSAHLLVKPKTPPSSLEDWVRLGGVMQRIWLTATQHGLHLQPEMTPVIFRWYVQAKRQFSVESEIAREALYLARNFETIAKEPEGEPFGFFGRVGVSEIPHSRSLRLDIEQLLKT